MGGGGWLLLALAGSLGTLARFGCTRLTQKLFSTSFPLGTLLVNLLGTLLAGLIWSASNHSFSLNHSEKILLFAGFFGSFTTFSTYMLDTVTLLRDGAWGSALGYLLLHNFLGLGAFFLGVWLG